MRVEDDRRFAGIATGGCGWQSWARLAMAGLLALVAVSLRRAGRNNRRSGFPATPLAIRERLLSLPARPDEPVARSGGGRGRASPLRRGCGGRQNRLATRRGWPGTRVSRERP